MDLFTALHSGLNSLFFAGRKTFRFRRPGYTESGENLPPLIEVAAQIDKKYELTESRQHLSAMTGAKALATLWYLEQMFGDAEWASSVEVVEPGCQGFSRLPAWRAYFKNKNVKTKIIGVELDPFTVLHDLHSRWDHAHYYINLEKDDARYEAADFFTWQGTADLILCFYPFVSEAPALAWGLPASFASPQKWIESFERVLKPGGKVLVVHQGEWEQSDFDEARNKMNTHLKLEKREVLSCPFFQTKHPACASIYKKN